MANAAPTPINHDDIFLESIYKIVVDEYPDKYFFGVAPIYADTNMFSNVIVFKKNPMDYFNFYITETTQFYRADQELPGKELAPFARELTPFERNTLLPSDLKPGQIYKVYSDNKVNEIREYKFHRFLGLSDDPLARNKKMRVVAFNIPEIGDKEYDMIATSGYYVHFQNVSTKYPSERKHRHPRDMTINARNLTEGELQNIAWARRKHAVGAWATYWNPLPENNSGAIGGRRRSYRKRKHARRTRRYIRRY